MFATYSKTTLTPELYKQICDYKKQKSTGLQPALEDITNKIQTPTSPNPDKKMKPKQTTTASDFQKFYLRGDYPVSVSFNGANRALKWLVEPSKIDLSRYLPSFLLGLVEVEEPFSFISEQACLQAITANGDKLIDILPDLILPIKYALDSENPKTVIKGLKVLQTLIKTNKKVAEVLIPFYKNLLPAFNRKIHINLNIGDQTEFSQKKKINISDLMIETLNLLETNGGADAFVNIKYMIPLYQSVTSKPK